MLFVFPILIKFLPLFARLFLFQNPSHSSDFTHFLKNFFSFFKTLSIVQISSFIHTSSLFSKTFPYFKFLPFSNSSTFINALPFLQIFSFFTSLLLFKVLPIFNFLLFLKILPCFQSSSFVLNSSFLQNSLLFQSFSLFSKFFFFFQNSFVFWNSSLFPTSFNNLNPFKSCVKGNVILARVIYRELCIMLLNVIHSY